MTRVTSAPDEAALFLQERPADAGSVFDAALAGHCQRLVRGDGVVLPLAVQRWHDDADDDDAWLLGRCTGPTLDLGCGPGRLVVAQAGNGVALVRQQLAKRGLTVTEEVYKRVEIIA